MHKPIKYAEKALTYAAGAAWFVFDKFNQIGQNPGFTPKWSDKPLLKSWEKTKPPLGWPRETDSLCPRCVPEIRQQILDGKTPLEVLYTDKPGEIKAQVIERDGKILMVKDCPIHGHFEDVMAIDPAFFKHLEDGLPGPRHPRAQRCEAAPSRHQHGHARTRFGADRRPDQPLQHDVRSVLHGRQPGRLRARIELGRYQDAARQRHHHQAEAPDVRAVLGRRTDHLAVLPGRGGVRARSGLHQRAGGHQRNRVRQESGVLPPGGRRGSALCLPAVRRHRQRGQRAPQGGQPVRRETARHREPVHQRRRHHPGDHDHQRHQQRAGGPHRAVRARQSEAHSVPLVPAGILHRPRRSRHRRTPRRPALHAVAPGARREESDRAGRTGARLVPDFVHVARSPTGATWCTVRRPIGAS